MGLCMQSRQQDGQMDGWVGINRRTMYVHATGFVNDDRVDSSMSIGKHYFTAAGVDEQH